MTTQLSDKPIVDCFADESDCKVVPLIPALAVIVLGWVAVAALCYGAWQLVQYLAEVL